MAAWAPAAEAPAPAVKRRPARPARRRRSVPERRVAGGVAWIGLVAVLLAGVVALNVAVLRLNMRLDELGRERAGLRAENAQLASRLSRAAAAGRIENLASTRLGLVPAQPDQMTYVRLRPDR
jgi:cell division protein FtsL